MQTEQARFNMIEQQIRPWDVSDSRVLDILSDIKRETFVPDQYKQLAFADIEIPLEENQYMMFPRIEARMLQALNIQPEDTLLEIGTGSGFISACMASLGKHLTSIDILPFFTEQAQTRLDNNNITNAKLLTGDGLSAPVSDATYDVIAVTGSVNHVSELLKKQLNLNGRMFVITGKAPVMQAMLFTRIDENSWDEQVLFETEHISLKMTEKTTAFVF